MQDQQMVCDCMILGLHLGHSALPTAARGQCWEHRLARELERTLGLDGSERGGDPGEWRLGPSSRVEFGRIKRDQVGSSRIESGSGIEDCMGDLLRGIGLILV